MVLEGSVSGAAYSREHYNSRTRLLSLVATSFTTQDSRGGGGRHSGTRWLPTAKRPHGAEAVNAKI